MDHGPDTRERIIYEKSGPIARITLNWPEKANAQDQKLAEEVDAVVNRGRTPLEAYAGLNRVAPAAEWDGTA